MIGGLVVVAAFGFLIAQQRSGSDEAAPERQVDALNTRIGALEASLAVATARTNAQAEVSAETAVLGSRLAETVQGLGTVAGAAGDAAAETAAAAPEGAAPEAPADITTAAPEGGTGLGETAILADGAIRAFVSRVDDAARTARLSINGAMSTAAVGEAVAVSVDGRACSVSADAIGGGTVSLSATCGAAAESAAAPAAAVDGMLTGVGETAIFADGAVRVFVARVAADAARIAVNGLETVTLAVGELTEAGDGCTVVLGGVDGNRASLGYSCGS